MGVDLWLPGKHYECTTPQPDGTLCGAKFLPGQEDRFDRHVKECSDRNADFARALAPSARLGPVFGGEPYDVEFEAWVKEHGPAIMEGRKRI
jgi:hypothetical protein